MPEIIRKVAEAKRLLETGEKTTVNGAAREVGISRSAFYKYKDAVHPFQDMLHGRIVTLQTVLRDEPGVLSGVLNVFAGTGINILTINQNIPVNGCAVVTITAEDPPPCGAPWRSCWPPRGAAPACCAVRSWPDNGPCF